jgi:hypothetical protein
MKRMKRYLRVCAIVIAAVVSTSALAKDLPDGGMTVEQVTAWLLDVGYQAKIVTDKNGNMTITSASDGIEFHVGFYDCHDRQCGSIQFFAGFDTKGALNLKKINEWNTTKRWARAYVDNTNDPWIEMDVDLTPGGTYEILNDQFATWQDTLRVFKKFINS